MSTEPGTLLKGVRPDLYRTNAFRLAQLPARATQRDMTRRLEKLAMQSKLGGAPEPQRGPLALSPPPDFDAMRQAVERLRDPEVRVLDEFFWFWPISTDPPDEALAALARGDVAAARKRWQESPTDGAALHNLAILAHLLALDLEQRALATGRALDDFVSRMRDRAWTDAWQNWAGVLANEEFWEKFRGRICELNEPQVPESVAGEIRRSLPVALLGINAELAVTWAERRLPLEAERHKQIVKHSGMDPIDADEALRRALRPIRERLKTLCATAGHDNSRAAVELFKGVAALPARASDRDNLLEDAGPALYRVCWFCQKQQSEPGSATTVELHGRVTRTPSPSGGGESVHWDRTWVEVPRCWQCSQTHGHWDLHQALGTVPAGVRPESEKTAFPFVAKHLAEGWRLGLTPEGF